MSEINVPGGEGEFFIVLAIEGKTDCGLNTARRLNTSILFLSSAKLLNFRVKVIFPFCNFRPHFRFALFNIEGHLEHFLLSWRFWPM